MLAKIFWASYFSYFYHCQQKFIASNALILKIIDFLAWIFIFPLISIPKSFEPQCLPPKQNNTVYSTDIRFNQPKLFLQNLELLRFVSSSVTPKDARNFFFIMLDWILINLRNQNGGKFDRNSKYGKIIMTKNFIQFQPFSCKLLFSVLYFGSNLKFDRGIAN